MSDDLYPCPRCQNTEFQRGFIDDIRQGRVRWVLGPMEFGPLGNARRTGRQNRAVLALRCTKCSRLELIASDPL